jgi:hypothetical protein
LALTFQEGDMQLSQVSNESLCSRALRAISLGTLERLTVAVAVVGWLVSGCGSSPGATNQDGSTRDTGGRSDGAVAGGGGGAAGRGGSAGTTGAAGVTGALPDLGKACAADSECTGGLTCITASSKVFLGSEGPANGYCSKTCAADADCSSTGLCINVSTSNLFPVLYCFQTCTYGGAAGSAKCHGRPDVGCLTIDSTTVPTTDFCDPLCSQDSDCPSGRHCDLSNGLCADNAPTGDPLGAHCTADPDGGASSCAGFCLPIGSAASTTPVANICTMACVVGNLNACNWVGAGTSLMSGGTHGVCALAGMSAMVGDVGFCAQECDATADCSDKTDPGVTCDTSLMSTIGHGICSWG